MTLPDHFQPFTALHGLTLAVCLGLIAAACIIGHRHGPTPARRRYERVWAWSIIISQIIFNLWWLWPSGSVHERDIPLNMCRLAVIPAAIAFLTLDPPHRWPRALLYFWGLGLCTQALITPVFPEGPSHPAFWIFWIGHTQIVGSAVYDLVIRRFRPTRRDFLIAATLGLVYAVLVFLINWAADTNYGGLGPTLFDAPNFARMLGDWPWRSLWIVLIALAWLAILWRLWPFTARLRRLRQPSP